jgi:hypothetical protein
MSILNETNQERPKTVESFQDQVSDDEDILNDGNTDSKKVTRLTLIKIVDVVVKFSEVLADFNFYPYEREFAERIVWSLINDDGETLTGEFSRQAGKSSTIAPTVVGCAIMLPLLAEIFKKAGIKSKLEKFEKGFWCGIYGPDYDRAAIIGKKINAILGSKKAKRILSTPKIGMQFPDKLSKYTGHLPRNSFIVVKSANKRVSIEGDTFHLVITDETQEISDYVIRKSMRPFAAATNGTFVHIGSAYPKRVYFYDVIQLNKESDINKSKRNKCHFEVDYKIAQKYNKNYKKYIEKEKRILGENSDEFRMSYCNVWAIDKGMFISKEFLIDNLAKQYYVSPYDKTNTHVIGIDVGKIQDPTVITVVEPDWKNPIVIDEDSGQTRFFKKIKNWYEIFNEDYDAQFYQICDFIDNYKWDVLVVDATSSIGGIADRLKVKYEKLGKRIVPFVFTRPDKSMLFQLFHREMLAERIIFPNNPAAQKLRKQQKFIAEMIDLAKVMEGGYLTVQNASDKGHDDYPVSAALAVYGVEGEDIRLEVAEEIVEPIYKVNRIDRNFWNAKNN